MKNLFDYITEVSVSSNDFTKHNSKYLKNLLKKLANPDVAAINLGSQGENSVIINKENAIEFVKKICKIDEVTPENIDKADLQNLSLADFNKELKDSKVGPTEWKGIHKEEVKDKMVQGLSGGDMEYIVALSINKNSKFEDDKYNGLSDVEMLRVIYGYDALKGGDKKAADAKINKLLAFYNSNKEQFDKTGKSMADSLGGINSPIVKLGNSEVKGDKSKDWNSMDTTPKTDLCTLDGKVRLSLKENKTGGTQLMSAKKGEAISTLKTALKMSKLAKEDKEKIEKAIQELDDLEWPTKNTENYKEINKDIQKKLNDIFKSSQEFAENASIAAGTGVGKFSEDSLAIPNAVLEFDLNNPEKCKVYDSKEYCACNGRAIYKAINNGDKYGISCTIKSNDEKHSYASMRMPLDERQMEKQGELPEKVDPKKFKDKWEKESPTKNLLGNNKNNEPEKDEDVNILKQEEVTDEKTGKKIKVITHTGPRGGKFYWPDGSPKDSEHKVYIERDK